MSKIREILSAWRTIQPEYESGDGEALDDAFEKDVAALEALQREQMLYELNKVRIILARIANEHAAFHGSEECPDTFNNFTKLGECISAIDARIAALKAEGVQLHKPYINNSSAENGTDAPEG